MNEDVKKNLRTQGKYSDNQALKNREKRQKESPVDKQPPGKKSHSQKRNSAGSKEQPFNEDPAAASVQYEENSNYSFEELEDAKKPIEIKEKGLHTLSETANGRSTILYDPDFFKPNEACDFYDNLCESTPWNEKNIIIHGKEHPQPRLVAWYGPFPYSYSGVILEPQEMPEIIHIIKERVEAYLKKHGIDVTLNSVLLNCYRNGKDSVAWHSDDELTMGVCPTIASVSFGETRKFEMRRKVRSYNPEISPNQVDQYFVQLCHGSLLIMNGSMQIDWQHQVPKEYHDKTRRINLTFRTVYSLEKIPSEIPTRGYSHYLAKSNETSKTSISLISDEDFPPLGSTVNSFCSGTDDSLQEKFEVSNSSFKTNEDAKSMDCYDDDDPNFSNSNTSSGIINDEKPLGILNKNIFTDNFIDNSEAMNADESWDRNDSADDNFYTNDRPMDESMESVVSNVPKYSCIDDIQPPFSPPSSSHLNAEAKEFVPSFSPIATSENVHQYNEDSLECLLETNITSLEDVVFLKYASALKERIMEEIHSFRPNESDELNFLGKLMEDELTIKNQKLVTGRMLKIVNKSYHRPPCSSNFRHNLKPYDSYTRQSHHVNEDYSNSNKSYSSQNRGNSSRGNNWRDEQYSIKGKPSHRSDYNKEEYSNREKGNSVQNEYDRKEKVYSNRGRANSNRGNRYHRESRNSNTEKRDSIQQNEYDRERYSNRDRVNSSRGRGLNYRERNSNTEGEKSNRDNEYDGREEYPNKERENTSREKGSKDLCGDEDHSNKKRGIPSHRKGYSENRRGGQASRGRDGSHD